MTAQALYVFGNEVRSYLTFSYIDTLKLLGTWKCKFSVIHMEIVSTCGNETAQFKEGTRR